MKTGRRSAQALVREVVMTLARFHIPGPLVLLALFGGCHGNQPLEPPTDDGPTLSAVSQKGPSGLVANPLPGAIGLGWQDNSPNETGFEGLRSTTGASGTFTTITTTTAKVTSTPTADWTRSSSTATGSRRSGSRSASSASPT